ncbi:hypothetical protein GCM10007874_11220 [Labrys miyagiensis]|uniref:Uncharacterized protein n=1 Tax=Labrys miyagiensis TaxID=346912 RepID=A0ABQ6CCX0_9HYPH|nr:hypothetical protein [Labrys miyagiensis]GLS18106.1 hypothetical protein GCM10007874_11220 [Labrys miyagiensis]
MSKHPQPGHCQIIPFRPQGEIQIFEEEPGDVWSVCHVHKGNRCSVFPFGFDHPQKAVAPARQYAKDTGIPFAENGDVSLHLEADGWCVDHLSRSGDSAALLERGIRTQAEAALLAEKWASKFGALFFRPYIYVPKGGAA